MIFAISVTTPVTETCEQQNRALDLMQQAAETLEADLREELGVGYTTTVQI